MPGSSIFDHEYILSYALAVAIGTIECVPAEAHANRNRPSMIRVLAMLLSKDDRSALADRVMRDIGHRPNLDDAELHPRGNAGAT